MQDNSRLPPFRTLAITGGLLSDAEMNRLIGQHESQVGQGQVGAGSENADVRRSQIHFFRNTPDNEWLYRRVWEAASECNARFMGADITGIEGNIQLARYDASDQGFYNWHTDFGRLAPNRKISISIQLSAPEDYDGGDLEFLFDTAPYRADRERGTFIAFPSFVVHRVAPVTRGTRWSLVAWITGPRWR